MPASPPPAGHPAPSGLSAAFSGRSLGWTGLSVAGAVSLAAVASMLITGLAYLVFFVFGDDTDDNGVPMYFRATLLQLAMALRAPLLMGVSSGIGGFGYRLIAVPLLLTALLVGTLAWLSRRAERSAPTGPGVVGLAVLSVASGFAAAALITLLGWLGGGEADTGGSFGPSLTFAVSYWQPLLFGTLLLSAAAAAGRISARRRMHPYDQVVAAADSARAFAGSSLRLVGNQLVFGSIGALAVAVVWVLVTRDLSAEALGAMIWALLFLPNLALASLGLTMGMTVAVGMNDQDHTIGLFSGAPAYAYLALLVPVLATILAAVREGLRFPDAGGWPRRWWQVPIVSLLAWLIIAIVIAVAVYADMSMFGGSTTDRWAVGFTLLSLLLSSIAWGLAAVAAQAFVPRIFAGMYPRLALRLGGRHTHPAWRQAIGGVLRRDVEGDTPAPDPAAPAPIEVRSRRLTGRLVAIALGVVLALAVAAFVVLAILGRTLYGPSATAERALQAVNTGDVAYLEKHVRRWPTGEPLLSADALRATHSGDKALRDISVVRTSPATGDFRTVTLSYTLEGEEREATLALTKEDGGGFFPTWKVDHLIGTVDISGPSRGGIYRVEGVEEPVSSSLRAAPGAYTVTADTGAGLSASDADVEVRAGAPARAEISLDVSEDARRRILAELDALVARCAATNNPSPPGCPFSTYAFDPQNFSWKVNSPPSDSAVVEYNRFDGGIRVSGTLDLTASYDRSDPFGGAAQPITQRLTPTYFLRADVTPDAVRLSTR